MSKYNEIKAALLGAGTVGGGVSIPMARAISFPLNHFTIIFETVMPAISLQLISALYIFAALVSPLPSLIQRNQFNLL